MSQARLEWWYKKLDREVEEIVRGMLEYLNRPEAELRAAVRKAYEFARGAHEGQVRLSGEPYITHPVAAARELLAVKPDLVTVQACLLHDVPEDTEYTNEDIAKSFGPEVAFITQGMEKIGKIKYRGEERQVQNVRKTFVYMAKDPRLILVKFADRIHNLKTLGSHPNPEKRKRIALETLEVYAPIADRLGVYAMREALENESFKHLLPEEHARIVRELEDMAAEREEFMKGAEAKMRSAITDPSIPAEMSFRAKTPYSVYKKLLRKPKDYRSARDLPDLFALRIVTDTVDHCYAILSMVHAKWQPIFLRFKDYVGKAKENGYQSLHTTVVGMFPFRVEVQIRTREMHERSEIGIAAHFAYAEAGKPVESRHEMWINQLREALKQKLDADFLEQARSTVLGDNVTVFTPKGQTVFLPVGSTPVDFAYAIHTDLGNRAVIARVDGRAVPLFTELASGNMVEIVTDKRARPQGSWLHFVKTAKAQQCVKAYLLKHRRPQLVEKGRAALEEYMLKNVGHRLDRSLSILDRVDGRTLDRKGKEEILVQLGNLTRKPGSLFRALDLDPETRRKLEEGRKARIEEAGAALAARRAKKAAEAKAAPAAETPAGAEPQERLPDAPEGQERRVIIGGQKSIPYRLATCCKPAERRNIVGIVRRDGVVRIHSADCPTVKKANQARVIPAFWEFMRDPDASLVRAKFTFRRSTSALARIAEILDDMGLDVRETAMRQLPGGDAEMDVTFEGRDDRPYAFDHVAERVRIEVPEFKEAKLLDKR